MKVLVVKTSSMGDVIHTLPALTDATRAVPGIRFDWAVEEGFAEIPAWHPAVDRVIPVALRRWRRSIGRTVAGGEWARFRRAIRAERYDAVIDAQGLLKSAALVTRLARGARHGLDRASAREPVASLFYGHRHRVEKGQHAVERVRQLFARTLGYPVPDGRGDFGIAGSFADGGAEDPYLVFLHGTTRHDKHWPEDYWRELCAIAAGEGWRVRLPWSNAAEEARARRLAEVSPRVEVLPRMGLTPLAQILAGAASVVSVDTGLSHLAAALDRPNVILFGPTDPGLVGGYGRNQTCLRAADFPPIGRRTDPIGFAPLTPAIVWSHVRQSPD